MRGGGGGCWSWCAGTSEVKVKSGDDLGNLMNWIDRVPHNVSVLVMKNSTFFGRRNLSFSNLSKRRETAPMRICCSDAVLPERKFAQPLCSRFQRNVVDVLWDFPAVCPGTEV